MEKVSVYIVYLLFPLSINCVTQNDSNKLKTKSPAKLNMLLSCIYFQTLGPKVQYFKCYKNANSKNGIMIPKATVIFMVYLCL